MTDISLADLVSRPTVGIRRVLPRSAAPGFFGPALNRVATALDAAGAEPAGPPFVRYRGSPADVVDIEVGFSLTVPYSESGSLTCDHLPAGPAVQTVHIGPYEHLPRTYRRIATWAAGRSLWLREDLWEEYESDPTTDPDPMTWRTRVVWPVALRRSGPADGLDRSAFLARPMLDYRRAREFGESLSDMAP
ncbi:GyrI-like domain-containing protein [Georgenia satyanarayanai]|uniref:GyrI-like domain-containing protein n=1 Tax=Georgenia satyanarayanai TaxID=860221 RepID=UPI00186B381D|nr:GyrI-like domain-containing protein [Georgenia satyanarayanai]